MKIIKKISDFRKLENLRAGCVLTIGNFDGIHIGHQQILTTGRKAADEKKTSFVMLTFEPHPLAVLYPEHSPGLLTPPALKKHLLEESGVDIRLALESSREFLQLPADDFLERFLAGQLRPAVVVEGDDFNFGAGRAGNITMLRQFAEKKRLRSGRCRFTGYYFSQWRDYQGIEHNASLYAATGSRSRCRFSPWQAVPADW